MPYLALRYFACVFAHIEDFFLKYVLFSKDKGILHFSGIVFFSEGELICKVFREIYTPGGYRGGWGEVPFW
jgi:hypothetical protein